MQADTTPFTTPAAGSNRIRISISKAERAISLAGGALLLSSGIRDIARNPVTAFAKALAGGYLLYRGASGQCPLRDAIKRIMEQQPETGAEEEQTRTGPATAAEEQAPRADIVTPPTPPTPPTSPTPDT